MPERDRIVRHFKTVLLATKEGLIEALDETRKFRERNFPGLSPETEFLAGAITTTVNIAGIVNPDVLPSPASDLLKTLKEIIPFYDLSLALAAVVASLVTIDGAKRIAEERVPLARMFLSTLIDELEKKRSKR